MDNIRKIIKEKAKEIEIEQEVKINKIEDIKVK